MFVSRVFLVPAHLRVCRMVATRTQEPLGEVPRSMAHMAALEVGLPTTREQEIMLAGVLSMGHTDPAGLHKYGIRAQEPCANPPGIKHLRKLGLQLCSARR
jgi:hypothetical protein